MSIVCCRRCKLCCLNPRPSDEDVSHLYDEQYYRDGATTGIGYSAEIRTPDLVRTLQPWYIPPLREVVDVRGKRVLDVGCSFGQLVYWLEKAGATCTGIDISDVGVDWGRKNLGLDLRQASVLDWNGPAGSFDVITLIDVIEHLTDPVTMLERIRHLLKPGGLLYIKTPNFGAYASAGKSWKYLYFSLEHLLYFNIESLDRTVSSRGFRPYCQTYAVCSEPLAVDQYRTHLARRSRLRDLVRRMPFADVMRRVRAAFCSTPARFPIDKTGTTGSAILGFYEKCET